MPKDFGTPGPRAIYPDACRSLSLAACSGDAERLFWRLVSQADDQGRLEGDTYAIKALCVPRVERLTPTRVSALLDELLEHGLIRIYRAGKLEHLVQLVTWWRWQGGMRRAYPSKWPAPEGWTDYVYGHPDDGPKTYREAAGLAKGARKLPADSAQVAGNLQADSAQLADSPAPAYAVPVPSAGAGARERRESQVPSAVPARNGQGHPAAQDTTTTGPRLTREQLDAWADFTDPAWAHFKPAWLARGLRLPPREDQRAVLWEIADARPHDIATWVEDAPPRATAHQVVAHVLQRWHELRDEAVARAEGDDADWLASKAAEG